MINMNHNKKKSHLEHKSNWSYFYQQFLNTDPRMRKKVLVGASMVMIVIATGVMLAANSLIKLSGSYIENKIADFKTSSAQKDSSEKI